ncbi:ferrous iron transport protein A [Vibrio sinensis]|uniref:Ferrous iron transport protein A n=1 Tax=Vibrio sinensis TaxID=2302434 RepID=A0A3A6R9Q8_9VIBR|nr:FeoA family protein [Vibrio sinensis]RJX73832.1 ferrous iron transport protein A [Vibrio sinensis]
MHLSQLQHGQTATIKGFTSLPSDIRKKLMVMGLLPNTTVRIVRQAPLGDPLQVEVRGVSLAIRKATADSILVEVSK